MLASLVTWHPSPHLALCPPNRKSPLRGIHILNKKTGKVDKVGRLALPWSSLRWLRVSLAVLCLSVPVNSSRSAVSSMLLAMSPTPAFSRYETRPRLL